MDGVSERFAGPSDLDVNLEAVRSKYRRERDKRLRSDGLDQYVEVKARFSRYVDDPYVVPGFTRQAVTDEADIVLIGAGLSNIVMGAKLREAGFDDLRFIDKAGDFGGTWYWNRYPGARCDVESCIYLPMLEEMGYFPREKYSTAREIREHAQAIARRYDLYRQAYFQTSVTGLAWDEEDNRWVIRTDRQDCIRARFVVNAIGQLHRPKLPGILGINEFSGYTFHTSRWDYRYTGGDESGYLPYLSGKRVGIIGTGATAVQCIPHLGEWSGHLYVFQRTPAAVDLRNNHVLDPQWGRSLLPGWQKERRENFSDLVSGGDRATDMVGDGWTDIFRNLTGIAAASASRKLGRRMTQEEKDGLLESADYRKMEEIRQRVGRVVADKATAEALKPWYRRFCKRPIFHDGYLETFNRPNVTLVDTDGRGVERLTETSIIAGGREYQVDCLIFASGFESPATNYARRCGYDVVGRHGALLSEKWSDGYRTFHGMHAHGFPNMFFLGVNQNGSSVNYMHTVDEQAERLTYILDQARVRQATVIEARRDAEAEWVAEIDRLALQGERFYAECTPGANNNEGKLGRTPISMVYGRGPMKFIQLMSQWRAVGRLEGLELSAPPPPAAAWVRRPVEMEVDNA